MQQLTRGVAFIVVFVLTLSLLAQEKPAPQPCQIVNGQYQTLPCANARIKQLEHDLAAAQEVLLAKQIGESRGYVQGLQQLGCREDAQTRSLTCAEPAKADQK